MEESIYLFSGLMEVEIELEGRKDVRRLKPEIVSMSPLVQASHGCHGMLRRIRGLNTRIKRRGSSGGPVRKD